MITISSVQSGIPWEDIRVEQLLVLWIKTYGPITSLDQWSREQGRDPKWIRHCAHAAAAKGLVKLTRLEDKSGRPYQVTIGGET